MSALLNATLNYFLKGGFHVCVVIPFTWRALISAGPRHVGALTKLKIWLPFKQFILKSFQHRIGLANILRARAQTADNIRRNSLAFGAPEFTSTIFLFIPVTFLRSLLGGVPAAAQLVRPLYLCILVPNICLYSCIKFIQFHQIHYKSKRPTGYRISRNALYQTLYIKINSTKQQL